MLTSRAAARWLSFAQLWWLAFAAFFWTQSLHAATNAVEVLVIQGTVEVARGGQTTWDLVSTNLPYRRLNPGDQIRTKDRSRATLRLSDLTIVELGPNAHVEVLRSEDQRSGFSVSRGLLYLFHRDKPGEFYFRTPTASPVIRGTEFNLNVADDGTTTLNLLEGEVALTNRFGALALKSGEAARVQATAAPTRIAALEAVNVIQWCLYYPAVLHPDELRLTPAERKALGESIAAYRRGDLLAAVAKYPAGRQPVSDHEKIYLAALLLAVGDVSGAESLMESLSGADETALRLRTALQTLVAAVKFQPLPAAARAPDATPLASELLANSYYQQSRFQLDAALASARAAALYAPDFAFGFAWARVAELEFSLGHTAEALEAVDRALRLSPRHAPAMTVKGFILASQNRIAEATAQFDDAIAADGKLGNAWLGRGLCRIRLGRTREGVADLVVAAAQEPDRALLRSYLGKGFYEINDVRRATSELKYAKHLDPNDPTAWLYSALINQQRNRINDAVDDLERSQALNDNRQLYRSRLLLDEDRSVRQANLASVYQDAGLFDQSVREASLAVDSDYANPSAHLFLANSYAQLTDLDSVNLRYETVTLSEYLVAQLLAPVGGNSLSPYVSQQEYSRLFQRNGFGLSSDTEYRSSGDWRQHGVQYGTFQNFDYALDAFYSSQNGYRPNNDSDLLSLSAAGRYQLSQQDTLFVQMVSTEFESGDLRQYFYETNARPALRIKESQEPNLFAGYHHEWAPGSHTLLLVGWLNDDFQYKDTNVFIPTLIRDFSGQVVAQEVPDFSTFNVKERSEFTAWSGELQQIWQAPKNTLIVGGRLQDGHTDTHLDLTEASTLGTYFLGLQDADTELRRAVAYAYDHWEALDRLWLIGGVSYDWISYPENIDLPPISAGQTEKDQISPKAGVIWQPTPAMTVRAAYTRSLGGLYFDQSVRLEPTHVAGFNQAFRSLVPASVAGLLSGAEFDTAGFDFSWRLPSRTYLGAGCEWLQSSGDRTVGVFDTQLFSSTSVASNTLQHLKFTETALTAGVNQLIGRDWSLGARYRISDAELRQRWVDVATPNVQQAFQEDSGVLQQLSLSAQWAHPSGFFAEAQALWQAQHSSHTDNLIVQGDFPDEAFWQLNLFGGYRFWKRRAEIVVGGLNLANQDYQLNPINLYPELPHGRTLLIGFKFNF